MTQSNRLGAHTCSRVVFYFFEYAEQANDEVDAIHCQTNPNEADQHNLVVADPIANATFMAAQISHGAGRSSKFIVPRRRGGWSAGHERGEIVVERKGERGRPSADE